MSKTMKMQWINVQRLLGKARRLNLLSDRQSSSGCNSFLYGPDVEAAKRNGLPLVALESTIITHGMPYPTNLETAIKVENAVRTKVIVVNFHTFERSI